MRDYADYFIDRKPPEKRGVSIHRDVDWWLESITGHMAKLLFVVLLALLALAIKSFLQVGKSQFFFPVDNITITGDVLITTPKDIGEALKDVSGDSFFAVDLNEVTQQLIDLPWIEAATVTRQWPDKLDIAIVEHKAAYRWGDNELVDKQGNRFANIDNSIFGDLPKLSGVDGHETEVISAYQELMDDLGISAERLDIDSFVLNQYLSWELHLKSGVVVKFGRDDYAKRVGRFAEAFQAGKLPKLAELKALDFRYQHGFAVKWKAEFSPQSGKGKMVKVATDI